jgi:hypothetical protein
MLVVKHGLSVRGLAMMLRQDKRMMPQPNNVPNTVHSLRRILGFREPKEFIRHYCPCEDHTWDVDEENTEAVCPKCSVHKRSAGKVCSLSSEHMNT